MRDAVRITAVVFTPAPALDRATGLLGWVRIAMDGAFEFDSVAVRRGRNGRVVLSFPSRRDGAGRRRYFVRPLSDEARCAIEGQVLELLRQRRLAS